MHQLHVPIDATTRWSDPYVRLLPSLLAMAVCTACGDQEPQTYPVQGRVQFEDGEPVTFGIVEFQSIARSVNARGEIARDGSFELSTFEDGDGAVVGRHLATVSQLVVADSTSGVRHDHGGLVAPEFSNYDTSGLEFTVKASDSNYLQIAVRARD